MGFIGFVCSRSVLKLLLRVKTFTFSFLMSEKLDKWLYSSFIVIYLHSAAFTLFPFSFR